MQSATSMCGVSFRKNPRPGQRLAIQAMAESDKLNVKLPTGYGKTFTACACYAVKQKQGVNRVLFVFPSIAQLEQFKENGAEDLLDAGVEGDRKIIDIGHQGIHALKFHRENKAHVYVINVQSLVTAAAQHVVDGLFSSGNWMIIVDEYHHYGMDKKWGAALTRLNYRALLAMSATPYRPEDDSAFGPPDIDVTYREAVDEGALKPLRGYSYCYTIEAIGNDTNELIEFTTDDLVREAGSSSPDAIEKFRITRNMRWSPKYISPLIIHPIDRMIEERARTGKRLQAIVGAMCCSHAEMVCTQIKAMYDDLEVDWVGTGERGRKPEDNRAVLSKFCPPKDKYGMRHPELDVLVHVGMAGEGLDSIHVTEVIHLNKASINNSNLQENGRAARLLLDRNGVPIVGHINFDSSSEFSSMGYVGHQIMDAMDGNAPVETVDEEQEKDQREFADLERMPILSEEPDIEIVNLRLEKIESGDPIISTTALALAEASVISGDLLAEILADKESHPKWSQIIECAQIVRKREADSFNESSRVRQLQEEVKRRTSYIASLAVKMSTDPKARREKSVIGDIKKRINIRKKRDCGAVTECADVLTEHCRWAARLEKEILMEGLPQWLL